MTVAISSAKRASKSKAPYEPTMSDDAVMTATGKSWSEWFKLLDRAGCAKMSHKQIVGVVSERFKVGPWWQQMVTVEYERARGLREVHQTTSGYSISASKTINASPDAAFRAWVDEKTRLRWLPERNLTIRKSTPHKSVRITWSDGKMNVDV